MVEVITILAVLVLMIITFALGTTLTKGDMMGAIRKKPKSLLLAIFVQYLLMPLYLYIIWHIFNLDAFSGVGMLVVGACPAGVGANLFTYLVHGDVALSIVATSVGTLLALGLIPLLLFIYVDQGGISDGSLQVDYVSTVVTGIVLLLPALVGIVIRYKSAKWAKIAEKIGSVIGIIFLIAAVIFGVYSESHMFYTPPGVWFAAWTLQPVGTAIGWFVAYMAGCPRKDQRVVALVTGAKNTTIAIAIVTLSYDDDKTIREKVLAYVLLETFAYLFNSIWIVLFFRFFVAPHDSKQDDKDVLPMAEDGAEMTNNPSARSGVSSSNSGVDLLGKTEGDV